MVMVIVSENKRKRMGYSKYVVKKIPHALLLTMTNTSGAFADFFC